MRMRLLHLSTASLTIGSLTIGSLTIASLGQVGTAQRGLETVPCKEGLIKTNAGKAAGKLFGKKIDHYCRLFDAFFKPMKIRKKNNNRIICRLFATYDEFDQFWRRRYDGSPPAAFFSPSLNALVLYNDPEDPWLRQTLFHEASHQYLNRYTYSAPKWFNEGLAEYFEGWWIPEGKEPERRVALFDLVVVQQAIRSGKYLHLKDLVEMKSEDFNDFTDKFEQFHHYLHYSTAWAFTYYCLEGPDQAMRKKWIDYLRELNRKGERAKFVIDDWEELEDDWKRFIMRLRPVRKNADDYLLMASAYRQNDEYDLAIREYSKVLKKHPETKKKVLYWLGACHKWNGDYDLSVPVLTEATQLTPKDARPYYYLARIAAGVDQDGAPQNPKRALEFARKAAELRPSSRYLAFLAECHGRAGDYKSAFAVMRKAIKSADKDYRKYYEKRMKALAEARRTSKSKKAKKAKSSKQSQ